jgi:hypothetical protein
MTLPDTGTGRSRADAALVAALIGGATLDEAADAANVSRRTVARRLTDPAFRGELEALRREALARAADRLAGLATAALETLEELLGAGNPPAIRLGAARAVLREANRFHEATELAARIEAIEHALREKPKPT